MSAAEGKRDNTLPSCSVCQRRKVRCDRNHPCAACKKSSLQCDYAESRRKRQRRAADADSSSSLRENTADSSNRESNPQSSWSDSSVTGRPWKGSSGDSIPAWTKFPRPRLASDGAGQKYMSNYIWNALPKPASIDDALQEGTSSVPVLSTETRDEGSRDGRLEARSYHSDLPPSRNLIFGPKSPAPLSLPSLPPGYVVALWQAYIQNVDPVFKLVHAPTVQPVVLGQIGKQALSMPEQCLVAAIFLISSISLTDEDCREAFHVQRDRLVRDLRTATEDALSAAGVATTSNIMVLQAFVFYIIALRALNETQSVWTMMGMASRIANTIGLSRDGNILNLPPFECEMRRRLWWTMIYVDARTGELVGQNGDLLVQPFEVQLPANLSDSELFPSMKNLPQSHFGPTESIYIVQRASVGASLCSTPGLLDLTRMRSTANRTEASLQQMSQAIDGIERKMEENTVQHCDPSVPLQLLTINSARLFLSKLRLITKLPPSGSVDIWSPEAFDLSLETIELQLAIWCEDSLKQWRWYYLPNMQWHALAVLILLSRQCPCTSKALRAWTVIRKSLDIFIPLVDIPAQKSLLLEAIRSLLDTAANDDSDSTHVQSSALADAAPLKGESRNRNIHRGRAWGTDRHNALLPGMLSGHRVSAVTSTAGTSLEAAELDLDAIDWEEFDRLAAELYGSEADSWQF